MCHREISTSGGSTTRERAIMREEGIAIVVAMMAVLLMMALGSALVMTTSAETTIAASFRDSTEGVYAADAALERAIDDLSTVGDWNLVLSGAVQSAFVDGPPAGTRALADGSTLDLAHLLSTANCSRLSPCSIDDLNTVTRARPWGVNNPRWQPYAYGSLTSLLPGGSVSSAFYVVVLVGDDGAENDSDPVKDGSEPCGGAEPAPGGDPPAPGCNPGSGVIELRAEAFGRRGAHKVVETTIARAFTTRRSTASDPANSGNLEGYNNQMEQSAVRVLSWREVR
jgi:type IV pilus assembly PilX-like protein